MAFFKKYFVHPAKRQIFGNASTEKCIPVLRVRHKKTSFVNYFILIHKALLCYELFINPQYTSQFDSDAVEALLDSKSLIYNGKNASES